MFTTPGPTAHPSVEFWGLRAQAFLGFKHLGFGDFWVLGLGFSGLCFQGLGLREPLDIPGTCRDSRNGGSVDTRDFHWILGLG